jgi:hypothetical protein
MRMHGIFLHRRRVRRTCAARLDFGDAGTREDLDVALAAAFVVAPDQPAIACDYAGIAGAEQRRSLVVGGEISEFCDHGRARTVDRRTGGRGVRGATGNAGFRQVGCARLERDAVDIETNGIGRDLGQCRPGALPHVMCADLHRAGSVTPDRRAGFGLEHQRGEGRGAHAPTDQKAGIVAHLPRLERTLRPAEARCTLLVAGSQRL